METKAPVNAGAFVLSAPTMFDKRTVWATLVATGSLQMVAFDF
jgi:hypothetical protein